MLAAVKRHLWIAAAPSVLASGVMLVFQQTLRGVNKPGHAMAGGLMQLCIKITVISWGAWRLKSLDVIWLAWPLSFIAGTVWPALICRKEYSRQKSEETP